jgi:hypothetical protein
VAAGAGAELSLSQQQLAAAAKRVKALEGECGELRRHRAQAAADRRMLEELLVESDAEKRWAWEV